MNGKRVWGGAMLILLCAAFVFAQDQANEIRCSGGGTTCKAGFVPKFATNGGSATVNDSIMSQSGSTIKVAGNETVTGSISASGTLSGGSISTGGGLSVSGNASVGGSVSAVFVGGSASSGPGVQGTTSSGESAVFGQNTTVGGFGVQGFAPATNGIGVAGSPSSFGSIAKGLIGNVPIGVIGDSPSGYGMAATSDGSNALIVGNGSGASASDSDCSSSVGSSSASMGALSSIGSSANVGSSTGNGSSSSACERIAVRRLELPRLLDDLLAEELELPSVALGWACCAD